MDIELAELLNGKSTIIKNKEYYPTKLYVEPFIEQMSKLTDDFRIQVRTPDQMTVTKDSTDVTYNRVLIQAVLPDKYCIDNHDEVYGFLYGLDVKKPVVKMYKGYLNRACTNLSVFDPQWMDIQELIPGEPINMKNLKGLIEKENDFQLTLQKLKNEYVNRDDRKRHLGNWVDFAIREYEDYGYGKVKLATSSAINAYKLLFVDSESPYYIPEGIDPTMFDIHGSFTQIITDDKKDILTKFEKTIIIGKMLGLVK